MPFLFQVLSYHLPTKQSWDSPGIAQARQQVEESKSDATQKAQFLSASAPHRGDWLLAHPVATCGLKLDNEMVRVAVALRLGLNLGAPHTCHFTTTQPHPQTGSKQDSQTSAPERPGDPCLGISGHPCHKGTSRSYTQRR